MKKRTIAPMIISLISGGLIILSVILMLLMGYKDNQFYAYTLLVVSGLMIIGGGLLSYFYNDRFAAVVILCFTILGFIALRMFYTHPILEITLAPTWILIIILLSLISSFAAIILAGYRLPVNQLKFDNSIFGDVPKNQKPSLIITVITSILLLLLFFNHIIMKGVYVEIVVFIVLLLVVVGKFISYVMKHRIGSLIILASTVVLLLGVNPKELSIDNTSVLLMTFAYITSIILSILEMVKYEEGEEVRIGPKEYKD
jgi:hypothetical protein